MFIKNKGITLIALVVTIIVLLVLAGISISMLTGQNGILNRASEAKEKTGTSNVEEQRKLAQAEALINLEDTTYQGVTISKGFAPTKIDEEDSVDKGLVITDGYGNEYVWIEVPKTEAVYKKAGINVTSFTDDEYAKIEEDLQTYTNVYRKGTSFSDTWYNASEDVNEKNLSDWYQNGNDYNIAKKKMLKSVYQNGGFWVGRYEAGIEINRTASGTATTIPLSKENLYPYTYVTRTQAKKLAEQVESGSYTSSLMFGVQWDLVLRYIEEKTVEATKENKDKVRTQIEETLNKDSTTIGNYYKAGRKIVRGQYASIADLTNWKKYNENMDNNVNNGTLVTGDSTIPTLITTGGSDETKLQNIYDIAGNVFEWTLEKTSNDSNPCAYRGGDHSYNGSNYPASYRSYNTTSYSNNRIGFRLSLY